MKYLVFILLIVGCGNTIQVDYPATPSPVPVPASSPIPEPEKVQEEKPIEIVVTPTPIPVPSVSPVPTITPIPTVTPTPTPTPIVPNCTLSQTGSQSQAYTNSHNHQPFTFTIQGSISCTKGNPDLFVLFAWQIENYCNVVAAPQHCELTMSAITGSFSVVSQTVNHKYVLPVLTVPIPASYY